MRWLTAAGMSAALAMSVHGQSAPPMAETVRVEFANPALSPTHWTLTLHPDGQGEFQWTAGKIEAGDPQGIQPPSQNRKIQVSAAFAAGIFQTARRHRWFNAPCESHLKVAFTGWKTLSYSGPEGSGSCVYNYSRDKEIEALGDSMTAVAQTILEGARLEMLLQYDRLGLDSELASLQRAVQDGRAQQVDAIRDILERLAGDQEVMERVRKRARLLLAQAGS